MSMNIDMFVKAGSVKLVAGKAGSTKIVAANIESLLQSKTRTLHVLDEPPEIELNGIGDGSVVIKSAKACSSLMGASADSFTQSKTDALKVGRKYGAKIYLK